MLRYLFCITVLSFLFFACAEEEKKIKIPENVLDKEKFSDLIVDFSLAESASGMNILHLQRSTQIDSVYAFNPLIDNNIKRETFDTTLYFYSHNPKLFKEVYEMVLEKLSKLQSSRK